MRTPEDSETDPDGLIRLGTIAGVDLAAARCTVEIDDGVETPPLRWIEWRMGKTRAWSPPSEGEEVVLLCPAGEIAGAVVLRGLVNDAFPAPSSDPVDLIEFEDGSALFYDAEASELVLNLQGKLRIIAPDGVEIDGDVSIEGDLIATGTITGETDVIADGISGKDHTHSGVQSGASSTGGPQ